MTMPLHITYESRHIDGGPVNILGPCPSRVRRPRRGYPALLLNHWLSGDNNQIIGNAATFADAGFVVACCDAGMHGHRRDAELVRKLNADPIGTQIAVLDQTLATLRKVASVIARRPDVDAQRLAVGGYSMGGLHAGAALVSDRRFKAAFVSISYPDVFGPPSRLATLPRTMTPDEQRYLTAHSLLRQPAKLAARPLLFVCGKQDPVFPWGEVRTAAAQLRREAYADHPRRLKLVGVPRCEHHLTPGMERQAIAWLKQWLN